MRGMNSNSVDLIYLDPPFNSKANYAAPIGSKAAGAEFKDTWYLDDIDKEWIQSIAKKYPKIYHVLLATMKDSDKAYLAYMAPRMIEMERILKPTGSIYLHCDSTMSHYLKLLMDAIFGRDNFRNEIVWKRSSNKNFSSQKQFGRVSDKILFYGSPINLSAVQIPLDEDYIRKFYRHDDEIYGRWQSDNLTGGALGGGESGEPWRGYDPSKFNRNWCLPSVSNYGKWLGEKVQGYLQEPSILKRLDMLNNAGMIHWTKNGVPRLKRFLLGDPKQTPNDIWSDLPALTAQSKEKVGFPTQKPLALLDRIIDASSKEGDIVFDPFCGCATTLVSAEFRPQRRRWVGIDISSKAAELVIERIESSQGMYKDIISRKEMPQRTDLGKLSHPRSHFNELYGNQGGYCNGCKEHYEPNICEVDHIIAKSKGGTDHIDNLQILCRPCNMKKGNRSMEYLTLANKRLKEILEIA